MSDVRSSLPRWAASQLADAVIVELVAAGELAYAEGGVRRPDHRPRLTPEQEAATERLEAVLSEGGLAPPLLDELPADLSGRSDLRSLLRRLEQQGTVQQVADGFYLMRHELDAAVTRIRRQLAGGTDLGPSDFRDVLPVSRKWLIPLLNYLDGQGVTVRKDRGRDVPQTG